VPWLLLPAWRALAILVIGLAVIGALLLIVARRRRRSFRR
jgi:LPXTG-motif cell wall-anchored protein